MRPASDILRKRAFYASIALHLCVLIALVVSTACQRKPPEKPHVVKVSLKQPAPSAPKKETPPTAQPKKETEQPKPQPKKETAQPKPQPKKETPQPKKETAQPKPQPKKETPKLSREEEMRQRLQAAQRVKEQPTSKPTKVPAKTTESKTSTYAKDFDSKMSGQQAADTANYADNVVRPYIYNNWRQPPRGQLEIANPRPVEVAFTVSAGGKISNFRIIKASNSKVLTDSVRNFFAGITHLPPLSDAGSKASQLNIVVTISLSN